MKAKTKKNILLLGGGLAVGVGIWYFTKPEAPPVPTPPALPPGNSPVYVPTPDNGNTTYTPPPVTPLKVGDTVKMKVYGKGYTGSFLTTAYAEGGSDNHGGISPGLFGGSISAIDSSTGNIKVSNYTYPMKSGTLNIYDFWLNKNSVIKGPI